MSKRFQLVILTATLIMSVFTVLDAYILPVKKIPRICTNLEIHRGRYSRTYYFLDVNRDRYGIDNAVYRAASPGDTVYIGRSLFTTAVEYIEVYSAGKTVRSDIGFIKNDGIIFFAFIIIVSFLVLVFYDQIPYKPGRPGIVIFLLILFLLAFYLHLIGSHESVT